MDADILDRLDRIEKSIESTRSTVERLANVWDAWAPHVDAMFNSPAAKFAAWRNGRKS